jgi:uncharacterized membrane protein YfcA
VPGPRAARAVSIGVVAGAFSGLTGVGGGSIMVPLLTRLLRLSQHRAHGTSLAIITVGASAGALGYWRAGNVDWALVGALTPGAVVGVFAGARMMVRVPAAQLRLLFGAFLLFVAFRQLVWQVSAGPAGAGAEGVLIEVLFGFLGGVLAGVLGVGGGAIFVPAIIIFGLAGDGDAQKVAQGVSLVVIVATGLAGTLTNLQQDTVDLSVARWTAPAALVAALAAALVANRLDATTLKQIYGITALLLGVETLYTGLRAARAGPLVREV